VQRDWPEFTDNDICQIRLWLPKEIDTQRFNLLPLILREWARVDLREHPAREPPATQRERRKRLKRLGKIAHQLLAALDELDSRDRSTLATQIGVAEGQAITEAIFDDKNEQRLTGSRNLIALLATAAKQPLQKPRRGQPRNISSYFVMMDIAAIFEYVTDIDATRRVDGDGDETGPFREFAGAIWSIVYGSDYGLYAALKNWASAHKKFGEQSRLIDNMALRHPEWGIFDRF
jgi:hypothetical protein